MISFVKFLLFLRFNTSILANNSSKMKSFLTYYIFFFQWQRPKPEPAVRSEPTEAFVCKYCGKVYKSNVGLWYHVRQHEGKFSYTCKYCGKGFNAKGNYSYHVSMHEGTGYGCFKCRTFFRVESQLKKHQSLCLK